MNPPGSFVDTQLSFRQLQQFHETTDRLVLDNTLWGSRRHLVATQSGGVQMLSVDRANGVADQLTKFAGAWGRVTHGGDGAVVFAAAPGHEQVAKQLLSPSEHAGPI